MTIVEYAEITYPINDCLLNLVIIGHKQEYEDVSIFFKHYPNFKTWINKIKKELRTNRKILFCFDFDKQNTMRIIGFTILKNTPQENKICSFMIFEKYKHQGNGNILMKRCIDLLKKNIIITMKIDSVKKFYPLLKKYNFHYIGNDIININNIECFFIKK